MKKLLPVLIAVTILGFSGCTLNFGPPRIINQTVDAPVGGDLGVVALTGSVEIVGGENSDVAITAEVRETTLGVLFGMNTPAEAIELSIDTTDGMIISHTPFDARGISVAYDIEVPAGTRIGTVISSTGSITVANVGGDPVLQTSTGSITADAVDGTVSAATSTGSVTVRNAWAVNSLSTSTGSITAEIRGLPGHEGPIPVTTSTGSVRLYIDPSLSLSIRAETGTGSINVHEDLQIVVTDLGNGEFEGIMNGGGNLLNIDTGTGSISLYPLD